MSKKRSLGLGIAIIFLVITLSLVLSSKLGVNADINFYYDVYPGSEEWDSFTSKSEMVEALRIPSEELIQMSTAELVEAVFDYPLLINLLVYDSSELALEQFQKDCDSYSELVKRDDAKEKLTLYINELSENQILELEASKVLFDSKEIFE